jgi:hypothetical protein
VPHGHPSATHAVVATHPTTGQVVPPHVVHAAAAADASHIPAAAQRFGALERAQALKVLLDGAGGYPCASFG